MRILGLDLGPNSIGWALVDENADGSSGQLLDCGVRVFPEGVDAFDTGKEQSRNERRRNKRMMRRQICRRARRKKIVAAALVEAGLLPADECERGTVLSLDPYPFRARAVTERLEPFEIGRVIYHLNQRRGFLSLKKVSPEKIAKELKAIEKKKASAAEKGEAGAAEKDDDDDDSKMLAAIELLAQKIGDRTLGQTLHEHQTATAKTTAAGVPIPVRIRNQHTRRSMIEEEFLRVWETQRAFHPALMTDAVCFGSTGKQDAQRTRKGMPRDKSNSLLQQFGLHGLIFHQRPIYWPREMIGMCELEKGQRRCPRADRRAQRFRMLQEINNLRYAPSGRMEEERGLDAQQRETLLAALYKKERLEFGALRRLLGLLESATFNLERGERASIKGCETDARISAAWKDWVKLEDPRKDAIVRILIDAERDAAEARERLICDQKLSDADADKLLGVDLPDGYVGYSLKAIEKLMPHLEKGLILTGRSDAEASAMHAAGYLRQDELERRLYDKLPSLGAIRSGPLADLPNPVVRATMHELRRLVNAVVRAYGKPDVVHVEMARSLKMSSVKRRAYNKKIHDREKERSRVAQILRDQKIAPTRDAVLKYRLWQEQKERCVYTGKAIGLGQLYDGSTEIDHILPYSLTLDDSQMNKVVCFRNANRDKNQRSPYGWLSGTDPRRLEQIEQWAAPLPWDKRRKLVQQEIKTKDFIQRQLVDTGYIAKLAVAYLNLLVETRDKVKGRKGTYTADLRRHWGIGRVIESLPESPAWQEKRDLSRGAKNRADHRHHALDAIVIALTNDRTLAAMHQRKETVSHVDRETGEVVEHQRFINDVPPPWGLDREMFRETVRSRLAAVNVSHAVRRAVRGGLHEETVYGAVYERVNGGVRKAKRRDGEFVVRKPVESLTIAEVERIRDEAIRKLVIDRLAEHGVKVGRGADKVPPKKMQEAMKGLCMTSGVPVRKVRVLRSDLTIQPIRHGKPHEAWVKPGSTHHLEIFEWEEQRTEGRAKTVRDAVFVSMLEARRRIKIQFHETKRLMAEGVPEAEARRRAHKDFPIIRKVHPERADARFVMSLSAGETVLAEGVKGRPSAVLLTFKTAASTQGQMYFAAVTDARRSGDQQKFVFNCSTLRGRKVTVDPLGRVRWAND